MNLEKIKILAEEKNISIRKIASEIEMTEQNLHANIRKNSIKAEHIEKIAKILSVPVSLFFEEGSNAAITVSTNIKGNNNTKSVTVANPDLENCRKEVEYLKEVNGLLKKQIEMYEKMVEK